MIMKNRLLYVAYFLLLIVLVGIIALSFRSDKKNTNQPKPQVSQSQPEKNKQQSASSQQTQKPANGSTGTPAGRSATGGLSDTGPGSTAAIFIGTVLMSSFAYSLYQRRKLSTR
jgi:hypothetical protein